MGWKGLHRGEGMLLRPTFSIHTTFVRFPIDVVFLDKEMKVVSIVHELKPWRFAGARKAKSVLELAAGECRRLGLGVRRPARVGDSLMASVVEHHRDHRAASRRRFRPIAVPSGVVAVAAIASAAAALIKFDLSARAFVAAFFAAVLVVLAAIDLERRIIPNRIVVPAGVVVLLGDIAAEPHRVKEWTIAAFASMFVALAISLGTRGGVGMGDVKLAFLLGAGLGVGVAGAALVATLATLRRLRRRSSPGTG